MSTFAEPHFGFGGSDLNLPVGGEVPITNPASADRDSNNTIVRLSAQPLYKAAGVGLLRLCRCTYV
jgi:hypothetical protein